MEAEKHPKVKGQGWKMAGILVEEFRRAVIQAGRKYFKPVTVPYKLIRDALRK